jgi:hypothetical protein
VNGYFYSTTDNGGTNNGTWTNKHQSGITIDHEGMITIFIWANDTAGNIGPAISDSIVIDTIPVKFKEPTFKFIQCKKEIEVTCGITIEDLEGSGVDKNSIEYCISSNGIQNFGEWKEVSPYEIGPGTNYTISTIVGRNENGYIKWRATDLAGNTGEFDPYKINILIDNDGDGIYDIDDTFPNEPNEWQDTDGDGTGNNKDPDDDNDEIPDHWELLHGLDPYQNDSGIDYDEDQLNNLGEYGNNTNPFNWDSDGDWVSDGEEIRRQTDPNDKNDRPLSPEAETNELDYLATTTILFLILIMLMIIFVLIPKMGKRN